MNPVDRKLPPPPAIDVGALVSDPELVGALLELGRVLELEGQLRILFDATTGWTAAAGGFVLGAEEDRRAVPPLWSSFPADDPRLAAFGRVEPGRIRGWLADGPQIWSGFGPLADGVTDWPDAEPAFSLALAVRGIEGNCVAALLLLLADEPGNGSLERALRLLELARPSITNGIQVRAIRDLVIKDDTAHCYNRRHFESSLPDELSRARRYNTPLSLIFLDMDNLKQVNNKHGHSAGSRSLSEVSRRIRGKIRRFDKLFRFGGDEFCIVLPETQWHGALEVAERVRDAIARHPFLLGEVADGAGIHMTASLGIASYPLHARDQKSLIEQADRAMQRVKNGTKNSIGISEIAGDERDDAE